MRSGSERMHTWRKTPSTGRNFQTMIIWITVIKRQVVMDQFLSINFFSWISSIFVGFFKSSRFFVSPCTYEAYSAYKIINKYQILGIKCYFSKHYSEYY